MDSQLEVRWLGRAVRNLDELAANIAADNPLAAEKLFRRILEKAELLERFPTMGRQGWMPGTRELVIASTPYLVTYRLALDRVEILSALHVALRWPKRF